MDFQELLLRAGKALGRNEVQALAFLCTDILNQELSSVGSAEHLFSLLADQDFLSAERPYLLADLLSAIQRHSLVRTLGLSGQKSRIKSLISPYRKLLYDLSEDITEKELRDIKFLSREILPRKKLEENVTILELFLEMEHKDLLSSSNLNRLENIVENVCPMWKKKINQFKAQNVTHTGPVTQETEAGCLRSKSVSDLYAQSQTAPPLVPERSASCEIPGFDEYSDSGLLPPAFFSQPLAQCTSMNPSNTSLDFPAVSNSGDEALSHGLSHLSTKTISHPHPVIISPIENSGVGETLSSANQASSNNKTCGPVHSQTTNKKEECATTYPMTGPPTGICLIINNYDFKKSPKVFSNREGTQIDERSLESVFKWLGFEIQIENDCTGDRMLSVVQELRGRDHSQMDCLVCCILSHGQEGSVYGVDGKVVQFSKLTEPFNGLQCASLKEKPKLFFIQACQGNREQEAVYIQTDSPAPSSVCSDAMVPRDSIPADADFLMGMATVPHFASFRDKKLGTWFMQSLCQNLVQMVPSGCDVLSILTKVNDDVSQKSDSSGAKKQMPQPAFSLRKRVIFPIPKDPPPCLP